MQAGLPADGGILVDEHFATPVPGVWAAGDVAAQHLPGYGRRVRVEHHDTALRHGRAVARNMLGRPEPFSDVHWFWSDQFEHTISSAGLRQIRSELAPLEGIEGFRVDWQWIPAWRPADITDGGREQLRAIGFTI